MNLAPASIFLSSLSRLSSSGFRNGFATAPTSIENGPSISVPSASTPFSRHPGGQFDKLGGINIENIGRFRTADQRLMITGHAEHILDSQTGGSQQIGLKGDAIPVAGDHLEDRFDTQFDRRHAGGHRRHRHAMRIVGHVDGHRFAAQSFQGRFGGRRRPQWRRARTRR